MLWLITCLHEFRQCFVFHWRFINIVCFVSRCSSLRIGLSSTYLLISVNLLIRSLLVFIHLISFILQILICLGNFELVVVSGITILYLWLLNFYCSNAYFLLLWTFWKCLLCMNEFGFKLMSMFAHVLTSIVQFIYMPLFCPIFHSTLQFSALSRVLLCWMLNPEKV